MNKEIPVLAPERVFRFEKYVANIRVLREADDVVEQALKVDEDRKPLDPKIAQYILDEFRKRGKLRLSIDQVKEAKDIEEVKFIEKSNYLKDTIPDRQKEVLRLVQDGLRDKEIGDVVCLSARTIGNHIRNLSHKFGLEAVNRIALAEEAARYGVIEESKQQLDGWLKSRVSELTPRQKEVLLALGECSGNRGFSEKMARDMKISIRTVGNHMMAIRCTTGVTERAKLVALAKYYKDSLKSQNEKSPN
jgi:DNA-binding NarL/FixJ family response regulator